MPPPAMWDLPVGQCFAKLPDGRRLRWRYDGEDSVAGVHDYARRLGELKCAYFYIHTKTCQRGSGGVSVVDGSRYLMPGPEPYFTLSPFAPRPAARGLLEDRMREMQSDLAAHGTAHSFATGTSLERFKERLEVAEKAAIRANVQKFLLCTHQVPGSRALLAEQVEGVRAWAESKGGVNGLMALYKDPDDRLLANIELLISELRPLEVERPLAVDVLPCSCGYGRHGHGPLPRPLTPPAKPLSAGQVESQMRKLFSFVGNAILRTDSARAKLLFEFVGHAHDRMMLGYMREWSSPEAHPYLQSRLEAIRAWVADHGGLEALARELERPGAHQPSFELPDGGRKVFPYQPPDDALAALVSDL